MLLTIVILAALVLGAVVATALMIRDVRRLHAGNRGLADAAGDAAGMSPAGMIYIGNEGAR